MAAPLFGGFYGLPVFCDRLWPAGLGDGVRPAEEAVKFAPNSTAIFRYSGPPGDVLGQMDDCPVTVLYPIHDSAAGEPSYACAAAAPSPVRRLLARESELQGV